MVSSKQKIHWFFYLCEYFVTGNDDTCSLKKKEVTCPHCLDKMSSQDKDRWTHPFYNTET